MDPIPSEGDLAEHYEDRTRAGSNYDLDRAPERRESLSGVLDFLEELAPARGRLLDVGCFDGGLLDLARNRGWDGWGLELQEEAARVADTRHPGRITRAAVEHADDLGLGRFEAIAAVGLVEHLRDPAALFRMARTQLSPGGLLLIQTPDRRSIPARALGRFWPPIAPPEHTFYFDRRTLCRIGERHGMVTIAARRDVKRLRVRYVYEQLEFFGPEIQRLLSPVMKILPPRLGETTLPFYGGETLFAARLEGRSP